MATKLRRQKELADVLFPERPDVGGIDVLDIPPEQRRLHTETYDFTISTIRDLLKDEKIKIPQFQRLYVWSRAQASRLIESLIIQCPIPVIYLDQASDGKLYVIDGNQRLMSIKLFLENRYPLKGLHAYPDLEGNRFLDLDPRFQNHIENRTLRCITILKETHPQIKFDVFERLNTGAIQLNAQELRHGLYYGSLMKEIDELAARDDWKVLLGIRSDKRMRGAELILRFFALSYDTAVYKKPLSSFINLFAEKHRNIDRNTFDDWRRRFEKTLIIARALFGRTAFRMFDSSLVPATSMNAALFDAQMVGISRVLPDVSGMTEAKRTDFLKAMFQLFSDPTFQRAISASTSDEVQVRNRIDGFERFLRGYNFN
jgi:hypothetical protein